MFNFQLGMLIGFFLGVLVMFMVLGLIHLSAEARRKKAPGPGSELPGKPGMTARRHLIPQSRVPRYLPVLPLEEPGAFIIRPRQTKARLKDGAVRYRQLVNMLPDPILMHCGGKCVFANAAAARLCGAAPPQGNAWPGYSLSAPSGLPVIHPTKDQFSLWRRARATSRN
jgi:PAS domain-containing protein